MKATLRIVNVTKTYRMGSTEVHALRGIDLEVKKGEMVAIMGPSGSGKSTLLNLIGALDKPSTGSVVIDGIDTSNASEDELTAIRRDKVGFIFQFYNLIPVLTALENVDLLSLIHI